MSIVPNTLLSLIDLIDEIEKLFHPVGNSGMPKVDTIHDVQAFQNWRQAIIFELQAIYNITKDQYIRDTLRCLKTPMNGFNDRIVFSESAGKLITIRNNFSRYSASESEKIVNEKERGITMERYPKVFISHSSKDRGYVTHIVNLLDGMGLNNNQLFCSSLPGYGIPIDTDIFDYLREQFLNYRLHVIFIHSKNYYSSPVSLNEMGASWVLRTTYTSILLPGFNYHEMTGVVNSESIAIKLDAPQFEVKDKLNQLHDKIVNEFRLMKKADIIWERRRDSFLEDIENEKRKGNAGRSGLVLPRY